MNRIPRESTADAVTQGHALPPPVGAEEFCPYSISKWERYWQNAFLSEEGIHPKKEPCCVCGRWKLQRNMNSILKASISADVLRKAVWSQLESLFACKGCSAACKVCGNPVPKLQVSYFNECLQCIEVQQKEFMERTGSKKAPAPKRKKSEYEKELEAKASAQLEARKVRAKTSASSVKTKPLIPSGSQGPNQLPNLWTKGPNP